jgi:transposase-like protein
MHFVTLSNWKKQLKEDGAKAFGGAGELKEKDEEKRVPALGRISPLPAHKP